MELIITIRQKVTDTLEVASNKMIILDDMKHNPDLQILDVIHKLKRDVIKKMDSAVSDLMNGSK